MRCPICLDDIHQAVMAPCCHAYCRPCIEAWNSNCPVCRGIGTPLIEVPWLDTQSSSSSSNDYLETREDKKDKELPRTNLHLRTLVGMLKQRVPETVPNYAEPNQLARLDRITKERDDRLATAKAEYEKAIEAAHSTYEYGLRSSYTRYEEDLQREAVRIKQIEADNEYVEYLIDIGTSLSTQRSEVLDKHFLPYVTKLHPYIPNSFMGLIDGVNVEFDMPETPVCYVAERNELLVSNNQQLYYYQKPNVSIPHSGVFTKFGYNLYVMEPTELHVYNCDLTLVRTERPNPGHYFLVVSNGKAVQVPVDGTFHWGEHTIDFREGYNRIWASRDSLILRRGNTVYVYTTNGSIGIYRPDSSIENHENGFITVTKNGQTLAFKVKTYQYQPESLEEITPSVCIHGNNVISLIASDCAIIGPKLGETYTYIAFGECQNGKRTLRMKVFNET